LHHGKVYEKLTNDFKVMPHVLMTMATEGHGEFGYYCSVVLDDKIIIDVLIIVITSMVISILVAIVLLRVLRGCALVIVLTRLFVA